MIEPRSQLARRASGGAQIERLSSSGTKAPSPRWASCSRGGSQNEQNRTGLGPSTYPAGLARAGRWSVMNNVSQRMQRRGVVVAALGTLLGIFSQASFTDATVSGRQRAKFTGDPKPACAAPAGEPQGPRGVAPAFSNVVEIARFDVRTVSK